MDVFDRRTKAIGAALGAGIAVGCSDNLTLSEFSENRRCTYSEAVVERVQSQYEKLVKRFSEDKARYSLETHLEGRGIALFNLVDSPGSAVLIASYKCEDKPLIYITESDPQSIDEISQILGETFPGYEVGHFTPRPDTEEYRNRDWQVGGRRFKTSLFIRNSESATQFVDSDKL